MPEMAGGELAMKIIAIRPDISIVMCTGYSDTMTKDKALGLGIKAFVMKPIVTKTLADAFRQVHDDYSGKK